MAEGSGVTDGEGDAVGVPVGCGVPVADADPAGVVRRAVGVVRGAVGVIRGAGLRVVGRGDAAGFGVGEVECCAVAFLVPVVTAGCGLNQT